MNNEPITFSNHSAKTNEHLTTRSVTTVASSCGAGGQRVRFFDMRASTTACPDGQAGGRGGHLDVRMVRRVVAGAEACSLSPIQRRILGHRQAWRQPLLSRRPVRPEIQRASTAGSRRSSERQAATEIRPPGTAKGASAASGCIGVHESGTTAVRRRRRPRRSAQI